MESAVPTIHLQPGKGISGLSFGASRLAVHDFFGVPRLSGQSAIGCEADHWPGVAAYFSSDKRLQALEFRSPCVFALDGTMISALDFDDAVAFLTARDQRTLSWSEATYFGQLSMTVCRSGPRALDRVAAGLAPRPHCRGLRALLPPPGGTRRGAPSQRRSRGFRRARVRRAPGACAVHRSDQRSVYPAAVLQGGAAGRAL